MQKIIIFLLLIIYSCDYKQESIGAANQIIIISSPEDKVHIENIVDDCFYEYINTPQEEQIYRIKYIKPWEFDSFNNYSNILIISLDRPNDNTGDLLYNKFMQNYESNSDIFFLENLYVNNQIIGIINSEDKDNLKNIFKKHTIWIKSNVNKNIENKIINDLYKYKSNDAIENQINYLFGSTFKVQEDYKIIKSDSLKNFIWIGRGHPYRWIVLFKSKKSNYMKNNQWNNLIKDYKEYLSDITISEHYRVDEYDDNNNLRKMRGLYEHEESDSGGPFFVYIFESDSPNEVILVSGFVNYPGGNKYLLLKQLEMIISSLNERS